MATSQSANLQGSSSHNRTGPCSGRIATDFSTSSKHEIDGFTNTCWACENVWFRQTDHAHVIPKTDVFEFLDHMEILDFQVSSAVNNGVILCRACHGGFDDHLNPQWVFYPSDLDYFIDFELEDRRARQAHPRPRNVPGAAAYLQHQKATSAVPDNAEYPLYVRRALIPEASVNIRLIAGERGWHGHPIAAIRSAWRCLGAIRGNRVPVEDRARLHYLLDLYRTPPEEEVTPPPGLPPRPPPPPPSDDNHSEEDAALGKGKGKAVETAGKKRPAPNVATRASERKRGRGGAVGKGRPMPKAIIDSALAGSKNTQPTDIGRWLEGVEDRTPPTTPTTPKLD